MAVISKVILCFCLSVASAGFVVAKEWRGIRPLHSTRDDVVRLLGPSTDANEFRSRYSLGDEDVYIVFSTKDNEHYECVKQLPSGTVMHIDITPKTELQVSTLHIDEKRFRKFDRSDPPNLGYIGYVDMEEGLIIKTYNGRVEEFLYIASAKDKHLCSSYYEKPEQFIQVFVDFDLFPRKFDEYGMLSFKDEKERLDQFATQLGVEPGAQAYVIVYTGRLTRPGEARERARRAKNYLERERRINPERIVIIDGGYRESRSVELWVRPAGATKPDITPTVQPRDVKIIGVRKLKTRRAPNY